MITHQRNGVVIRTQIQLGNTQAEALKRCARTNGVSMAEAIRRAIDLYLAQQLAANDLKRDRALTAVGAFSADPNLSRDHDEHAFPMEGN